MRRAIAPVNAPFSWPNSSDSSSVSGIAAQLTQISGFLARPERAWTKRASTSLPVPDSPVISTEASLAGDLLRELDHARHGVVAIDQFAPVVGDRGKHRGDQFGVGRQRDVFLGAGVDGGDRGAGVGRGAAGDDRRMDAFGLERGDQFADIDGDIDHQQVGAAAGAQHGERLAAVGGMGDHARPCPSRSWSRW